MFRVNREKFKIFVSDIENELIVKPYARRDIAFDLHGLSSTYHHRGGNRSEISRRIVTRNGVVGVVRNSTDYPINQKDLQQPHSDTTGHVSHERPAAITARLGGVFIIRGLYVSRAPTRYELA